MFFVYVLKSLRNSKQYVGFTTKLPEVRLFEHNAGTNAWTRQNRPHELIYYETFQTEQEARKREKFLKSGQGRQWIKENILIPR